MNTSQLELNAVLAAFQLPSFHPDVPLYPIISSNKHDTTELTRMLIDAGVINLRHIPNDVDRPEEILLHGLSRWFKDRTAKLKFVKFSMRLLDSASSMECLLGLEHYDRTFNGNNVLTMNGESDSIYFVEKTALSLDRVCKGLFRTAFDAIEQASWRTVPIRTPYEIATHFSYMHWETDLTEIPTDAEARETLAERMGETGEAEEYLPSACLPNFGKGLCFDLNNRKPKLLSMRRLKKVAIETRNRKAKAIALQTIELLKAIKTAKKAKAELPDLCGISASMTTHGCTLLYKQNSILLEALDDLVNMDWNSGEGTDLLGLQELPNTAPELKDYFSKLDIAFNVLRHMDKLISMVVSAKY